MTLVDSSNEQIYLLNKACPLHKVQRIALIKMFEYFFIDNIFAMIDERVFQDSRHTYDYKRCSSSRCIVLLLAWGILHTGTSQVKRNEASPIH